MGFFKTISSHEDQLLIMASDIYLKYIDNIKEYLLSEDILPCPYMTYHNGISSSVLYLKDEDVYDGSWAYGINKEKFVQAVYKKLKEDYTISLFNKNYIEKIYDPRDNTHKT